MARLLALDARGELTTGHARLVASALGVSLRTVWNWVAVARREGCLSPCGRSRVKVTADLRSRLAVWGGNVAAVHRELVAEADAVAEAGAVPSVRTLQRAARLDLSAGERAGLRAGEAGRRGHDVYGKRPPVHRNACWEGDHKRVPVRVDVEGRAACPWVTWFIDVATKVIVGVAVTPHEPARDAVLAALRTGISRADPHGPWGGLPAVLRVDRGKEFLCRAVSRALGAFAVPVEDLPAYMPYRKGTIEQLNDAVEEMFLVSLPGYTRRARPVGAHRPDQVEDLLSFADFVEVLLGWVRWWNTQHRPTGLPPGLTPAAAWEADQAPVEDVDEKCWRSSRWRTTAGCGRSRRTGSGGGDAATSRGTDEIALIRALRGTKSGRFPRASRSFPRSQVTPCKCRGSRALVKSRVRVTLGAHQFDSGGLQSRRADALRNTANSALGPRSAGSAGVVVLVNALPRAAPGRGAGRAPARCAQWGHLGASTSAPPWSTVPPASALGWEPGAHLCGHVCHRAPGLETLDQEPPAVNGQSGIAVGHEDLRAVQS